MKSFWLTRALLGIGALLIVALIGLAWNIYVYSGTSPSLQADAAIVLGAAAWGERPSPVFQERINHAIELYRHGAIRAIIFTGGIGNRGGPAESVVARQYALERGIPESDILIETRSRTTEQNLLYAYQAAANRPWSTFLIVSDPLHMKRAVSIARDLGMDAYPSPTPTTRYQSLGSQADFLVQETYVYLGYLVRRRFVPRDCVG